MIWIGVDCGVKGALAFLMEEGITFWDMPVRKATRGHEFEPFELVELLKAQAEPRFVMLEQVSIRPNESGPSGLKIGKGFGILQGILAALALPHEVVTPQAWKKHYSLTGQDKKASRARAQELFPEIADELRRRRPDFSEALLLAAYARHRHR
jgi:Holliday junction resolvasome RuvABC endonuclease subunit